MTPLFTVPITVVTRTVSSRDAYGNDVSTTSTVVVDGVFAPGGSVERLAGGDTVTTQPTVYLPSPAPKAVDAVTVAGVTYEVDGQPQTWPAHPFTGWVPDLPVVVPLRRVTG